MFSKISFFLLVVVFLTFPINSMAQEQQEEITVDFPFAYTQSVVRNSAGDLIVYQENYSPIVSNQELFNDLLNQQVARGEAELILLDLGDRTLELIQFQTTEVFEYDQLRAWDELRGTFDDEVVRFVIFFHEGYPVSEGDVLTITWSFVRQT